MGEVNKQKQSYSSTLRINLKINFVESQVSNNVKLWQTGINKIIQWIISFKTLQATFQIKKKKSNNDLQYFVKACVKNYKGSSYVTADL